MEPLKPLKPLGAPQGVKPLGTPQGVKPLAPITKPVAETAPKDNKESYNKLFGGSEAPSPETNPVSTEVAEKEVKEVASKVAKQMVDAVKGKAEKASKPKSSGDEEKEAPQSKGSYSGPRHVKVYGNLLFTEEDPKVKMEDIRKRIVEEYGFEEFSASRTKMSLDESTGIVVPEISFQKKG